MSAQAVEDQDTQPGSADAASATALDAGRGDDGKEVGPVRSWMRANLVLSSLFALGLAAASTWLLLQAVSRQQLGSAVLVTVVGAAVGAGALLVIDQILAAIDGHAAKEGPSRWAWCRRWCPWGLAALASTTTFAGLVFANQLVTVIGMILVMVLALVVRMRLEPILHWRPEAWVVGGVALMVLGASLLATGAAGAGLAGVALALAGLGAVKLAALPLIDRGRSVDESAEPSQLPEEELERMRTSRSIAWFAVGAVAAIAGFAALIYGSGPSVQSPIWLAFGLFLGLAGLSIVGVAAIRPQLSSPWMVGAVLAVGAGVILAGGWMVLDVVGDWYEVALIVSLLLAASGAWFVFRGEGLLFLVLLTFVLAWALHDRDSQMVTPADDPAAGGLLALGDSYISGEGAPDFLVDTNSRYADTLAEDDPAAAERGNECRRADTSYPAVVANESGLNLHHLACSGADIDNVLDRGQATNYGSEVAGWQAQLHHWEQDVPQSERDALDVVLVGIGGNDTGFGTIVKACLLPSDCSDDADRWIAKAESLEGDLQIAYEKIDAATGDAPVVVVPYPELFDDFDCDRAISGDEVAFVVDFVQALNKTIYRAAAAAGVMVADTATTFADHGHCADEPATNLVVLAPTSGPLSQRLLPSNWVHGSMHPRVLGHELEAAVITDLVGELRLEEDGDPSPFLVDLDNVDNSRSELNGDRQTLEVDADRLLNPGPQEAWLNDLLYDAARRTIPGVALLLAGGVILAFGLVNTKTRWTRFLVTPPRRNHPSP